MRPLYSLLTKLNKKIGRNFLLIILSLLLLFGCSTGDQIGGSEYQEMSLNAAQGLLLFDVCLPSYIPDGLHQDTTVIYQADFDDPIEGNVRISYLNDEDDNLSLSISEYYAPVNNQKPPDDQEFDSNILTRDLLAWIVGWDDVSNHRDEVSARYEVIKNDDGIDYRTLVITDPPSLRGTIIRWPLGPVGFDVYSYLPYNITLSLSQSIKDCNH